MKTTKFNIALLLGAMAFSAYASGQHNLSNGKSPINQIDQNEITGNAVSNASLNAFKVKIFQNPSNSGNIVMAWKGSAKIDQIRVLTTDNEKELNFYVKGQNNLELNNLENGTYYVWFYENKKVVGVQQVKVKLAKKDKLDFNLEHKDDMSNHSQFSLNTLDVKIYPNPSTTGKIKMEWLDGQNIDQIVIVAQGQDNMLNFFVKKQSELTVDDLENGKYFIRFYSNKKLLGIKQIKVMKL
jgi:hypothetical protein